MLATRTIEKGLSVRALEALAREIVDGASSADPSTSEPDVGTTKDGGLAEVEQLLADRFETKVSISLGSKRGKLTIDFADLDDLERIYFRSC